MFASTLSFFLFATTALASVARVSEPSNLSGPHRCSTTISDEKITAAETHFVANKASQPLAERAFGSAVIQVAFHVISADNTLAGGNLPDALILRQMQVLNNGFANSGLSFNLANVDRTVHADWFYNAAPDSTQQHAMKAALRKGGRDFLNIYSVGFRSTDHFSYATFPIDVAGKPIDDGVVFLCSSVPGGPSPPYNGGKTLIHAVGHWVGLYDTFQGGCEGEGDHVFDTPAEATPAFGCHEDRNSCPAPGTDPIHNYMDYSDDACVNQFTVGQIERLRAQLTTYRGVRP